MRGELRWAGGRECEWSFLSHEFTYFKGLGITKEDLVEEGVPVISYGQVHAKNNDGVHLKRELLRFIPRELAEGNESSQLRRGDIVFADTSEDFEGAGNCVLLDTDDEVYAGYHTIVARPRDPSLATYYAWMFQSSAWRGQIKSKLCGIKVYSITRKILKGVTVISPSPATQQRNVDYLDEKTAAIDGRVAVLEKKLAVYKRLKKSIINQAVTRGLDPNAKLKDSGVDWIGKVPEGWRHARQLDISSQVKDKNFGMKVKNLLSLSYGKIIRKDIDAATGLLPESFDGYNIVRHGDVVIRLTDLQNDHRSIRVGRVSELGIITSAYTTLRPSVHICPGYFYYAMLTFDIRKELYGMGGGVRQSLNYDEFKRMAIPVPPLAEQRAIADYLDAECAKIDRAAEIVAKQIDAYKRLKRSLIDEVVTGRRKVA